jgi:ADP-ribose pyrophosphatase YjhB (NUDIX family)
VNLPSTHHYCSQCGSHLAARFVPEEGRERLVCASCRYIHYVNPHIVAGTIPVSEGRVFLLRRAIEPRLGYWTFPAGFMEMGETVQEAAARETLEELNLRVRLRNLLGIYSRPTMTTVHIIYLADAISEPSLGTEALEFSSFRRDEIPWEDLAFWSTQAALRDWIETLG